MSLISRPIKAIDRLRIGQQMYGAFAVVLVLTAVAGGLQLPWQGRRQHDH